MDKLAEALPPGRLLEWIAFERLEPDSIETLIDVMKLGLAAISKGLEFDPDMIDPRRHEGQEATPKQQLAALKARLG